VRSDAALPLASAALVGFLPLTCRFRGLVDALLTLECGRFGGMMKRFNVTSAEDNGYVMVLCDAGPLVTTGSRGGSSDRLAR
jgi:hypothetical protein